MKITVDELIPRIEPGISFMTHDLGSKSQFMKKVPGRLLGYSYQMFGGDDFAVLLVRDRDQEDCRQIVSALQHAAQLANIEVASVARRETGRVVVRLADEMLEAWFLGDGRALNAAFDKIPASISDRKTYRTPDRVRDPARRLESELQGHGYYQGGLSKTGLASAVAPQLDVYSNNSTSFGHFREGVRFLSQVHFVNED